MPTSKFIFCKNKHSTSFNFCKKVLFLLSIRMSKKTLKFGNIRGIKKEFHKSKQPINLDLYSI